MTRKHLGAILILLAFALLGLDRGVIPGPGQKATQATFVYEKSLHAIPAVIESAISKANVPGFIASKFEQDTVNAAGQTPAQYVVALKAAKEAGLPCLVVQAGTTVVKVVKTEAEMLEVLK